MMKLAVLLLLPLALQYWEDSDAVRNLKGHVAEITLSQNEGRAPGSEGEKAVAAYVWEKMTSYGLDMLSGREGDVFGIARPEKGDTISSRNIAGMIEGYDAALRQHFIVVGARMDNLGVNILNVDGTPVRQVYSGANGNASGVAMLLELASKAASGSLLLRRSVIFVAFGSSTSSLAGAWHFLHHTFSKDIDKIDAMVDLDMLGISRDGMMAFTGGNEDINLMLSKLASARQPLNPKIVGTEPYPSDYQVFYAAEIPSVLFTTGRYPEHNTYRDTPDILDYDFMEREGEFLYNFLLQICNGPAGVPSFRTVPAAPAKDDVLIPGWSDCDVPPAFINNRNPSYFLEKWVYQYLKYPAECIRDGIQGIVMVDFVIGKDGKLRDVSISRSIHPLLDEATLKVVNASPKWQPGRIKGQKVDCRMTIPVEFRLKKKK